MRGVYRIVDEAMKMSRRLLTGSTRSHTTGSGASYIVFYILVEWSDCENGGDCL
jgi:hypothetical protein